MVELMLALFTADPLVKILPDTPVPEESPGVVTLFCARNEYEPAQVALRANVDLTNVTVRLAPLAHEGGAYTLPEAHVRWNFAGIIPLPKNTPGTPAPSLVCEAPAEVPDPLLADRTKDVPADRTQVIWLTVYVPEEAPAGLYRGAVTVTCDQGEASLPMELTVWPFTVPQERHLDVTNWFSTGNIARSHGVAEWSEEFWAVFEKYLRNMAAHRQNVAWVPWRLIEVTREADGKLTFDYRRFDRYVELMEKCGVADRIELQFTAGFGEGGWSGSEIVWTTVRATDRASGEGVNLGFEDGLAPLLADLEKHLDERGWLDRAVLHLADEPSLNNRDSWREKSALLHRAAPRLKRIDALEGTGFEGECEVLVPKLSHLANWFDDYKRAQAEGAELWYYICCHPWGGQYPNRFLDYPLAKVRLLHWLNMAYDLDGYLHWGLNHWGEDPFGPPSDQLPPGDTHVIYPGPDGPLDSIRWETQRDSLEDFEYLWLLTERLTAVKEKLGEAAAEFDPKQRAKEFCHRLISSFTVTTSDPAAIQGARKELAAEIMAAETEPLALVWTKPLAGTVLVPGPIVVELYGATEPGATVQVNGGERPVDEQGRFSALVFLSAGHSTITVEVEKDGQSRTLRRWFPVREL